MTENNSDNPDVVSGSSPNGTTIFQYQPKKPWPPIGLVFYHLVLPFIVLFITQIISLVIGFIVFLNTEGGAVFLEQIKSFGTEMATATGVNQDFFAIVTALVGEMLQSPIFLLAMALGYALTIVVYVLIVKVFEKQSLETMGLSFPGTHSGFRIFFSYMRGLGIGLGMMAVVFFSLVLSGQANITDFGIGSQDILIFILYILMWIPQGASEEIMIRGYMLPRLGAAFGTRIAVVATSVFFAFMHTSNSGFSFVPFINLILVALFFALLSIRTQEIWTVCGLHSMWNFAQGNIFGFKVSGITTSTSVIRAQDTPESFSILTGGLFGPEGGLAVTLVLILAIGLLSILRAPRNRSSGNS